MQVSRDGMIGAGINTRVGPICRTVDDAARLLSAIAGHDPRDELTAFAVGRLPPHPYESYTSGGADALRAPADAWAHGSAAPLAPALQPTRPLAGVRIGVVREFMDVGALPVSDHGNIRVVAAAVEQLRALGAAIVEPADGEGGLFSPCVHGCASAARACFSPPVLVSMSCNRMCWRLSARFDACIILQLIAWSPACREQVYPTAVPRAAQRRLRAGGAGAFP
jgi:hypothetical protein